VNECIKLRNKVNLEELPRGKFVVDGD